MNALGSEVNLAETNPDEEIDVLGRIFSNLISIQGSRSHLSRYMKGSKREVKSAKQSFDLTLDEGEKPMSKNVYRKLCEWLFQSFRQKNFSAEMYSFPIGLA